MYLQLKLTSAVNPQWSTRRRGGGGLPMMAYTGGSARKGYLFLASGI